MDTPLSKYSTRFPSINDRFCDLMDEIESEATSSLDPDVFGKIGAELEYAAKQYISECQARKDKIDVCENLAIALCDAVVLLNDIQPVVSSSSINQLKNEPIKIDAIPSIYLDRPYTRTHVEQVLEVLREKYQINLSLDGKLVDDIKYLSLEEIGIGAMDVKLFIPSMFMNKVNSCRNPDNSTFLYQEDYNFIEMISNNGTLENLAQLYATLDDRRK